MHTTMSNLLRLLALISSLVLASGQPILPLDEVNALREIATTLGKMDWNFGVDPCSGGSGWIQPNTTNADTNSVTCNCTYDNYTTCHVISIALKAQNLTGTLPPELVKLPFLQEIDLTRNYLNGTIPKEWGSMKLVNISVLANRLTGPIPKELGNISTLANLTLDYNRLTGSIPPEFGNLASIDKLVFTSNNLSGTIPETLAKLTTMRDFRISDNNFSGSIPTFIENWTNIEKLIIQGSGLTGPIPSGIASLTKLTDLRISDLNVIESTFPPLFSTSNLKYLVLRSCNIVGELPNYIGSMKGLQVLDLSFNKLSGPIPDSYDGLNEVDFIYLTGNLLTGPVPNWMTSRGKAIDLSYNNFTYEISNCQPRTTNLFASSKGNTSGIVKCLNSSCEQMHYSLHINCGGHQVDVVDNKGTTTYEEDVNSGGPSNFFQGKTNWGFSSTGNFLDDKLRDSNIIPNISSIAGQNPQLYVDARLAPMSLTYYGFCMKNGKYTVTLHFAEIMFTDDRTYASLGRRIFDVYIQGNRVLKDFNIADEAGGVNKGITKNFSANITDNSLDIRFYWAGKGTNGVPVRGVYGPLISAISVSPDFKLPSDGISAGAIVGIVFAVLLTVILLILGIFWWTGCLGRRDTLEYDLRGLDPNTGLFTLRQIKAATNNFDPSNKIGEGGFGPVYKGLLSNGTVIAVKQLSSKSKQGNREFVNEIGMISALQHPHLVKLYGCCIEGNQLLLIYEYMENNSLARALFGPEEHQLNLDWPTRHKICIGLARGLAHLHEESRLKIVHRDIKATNVLLDKDLNPKISDFGLAKLDDEDNTHISTRIAGTFGYMAPEYAMRGHLTEKADVYSFGIVLLEIVSGRSNSISLRSKEDAFYLLDWAHFLKEKGDLMELVDPRLSRSNFNEKEVMITINVALHCANVVASERPTMSAVVSILEGRAVIQEFVSDSSFSVEQIDSHEMYREEQVMLNNNGRGKSVSTDVPWTGSSTSASDLYPLTLDSSYWEKRL